MKLITKLYVRASNSVYRQSQTLNLKFQTILIIGGALVLLYLYSKYKKTHGG